jgi:hypothetical protein
MYTSKTLDIQLTRYISMLTNFRAGGEYINRNMRSATKMYPF